MADRIKQLHPLESAALSRRTPEADIGVRQGHTDGLVMRGEPEQAKPP
jgi:hypothetical protein